MVNLEVAGIVGADRFALEAKGKRDHLRPGEEASAALEHSAPWSRVMGVTDVPPVNMIVSMRCSC